MIASIPLSAVASPAALPAGRRSRHRFPRALACLAALTLAPSASAQSMPFGGHKEDYQVESDPFQGDWAGHWGGGREVVAMVIARGDGRYEVRVQDHFDERTAPYVIAPANVHGKTLRLKAPGWHGEFHGGVFIGRGRFRNDQTDTLELRPVTRRSPTLGAPPPAGAVVLFDGSGFGAWESSRRDDDRITWRLTPDGAMEIGVDAQGKGHALRTRRAFGDVRLHLEFRLPLLPRNTGQPRGNSGLFIQGYEVQILDSYGLEGYNNECGAFYKFKAPAVNMCYPPLQWQTYDVDYTAARFDAAGRVLSPPRFTVRHNGQVIHRGVKMDHPPVFKDGVMVRPPRNPQPILLQFHGSRVRFRNIWAVTPAP